MMIAAIPISSASNTTSSVAAQQQQQTSSNTSTSLVNTVTLSSAAAVANNSIPLLHLPDHFALVSPGVYRSASLHPLHFQFLKSLELKTLLLLSAESPTRILQSFLQDLGVKLVCKYARKFHISCTSLT